MFASLSWKVVKEWVVDHLPQILTVILIVGLSVTVYVQHRHNIALEVAKTTAEKQAAENKALYDQALEDAKRANDLLNGVVTEQRDNAAKLRKLEQSFTKNGRNFGKLATEKPKRVEKIINDATRKQLECVNTVTAGGTCE